MKAQSALEYLMIVAITLMIILPSTYLFYTYSKQLTDEAIYPQINEIGLGIINNAHSVYFSGEYSKIVMDVNMPKKVNDIYILYNRELIFNVESDIGSSDIVFFSNINITSSSCSNDICSLSELTLSGLKKIKMESINEGKQVIITKYDE